MDSPITSSSIGWGTGVDEAPSSSTHPTTNGYPNGHRPPSRSAPRSTPRDAPLPNGTTAAREHSGRRGDADRPPPHTNGDVPPSRDDHRRTSAYDDRPPSNYYDYPPARYPPYDDRPSSYYNDRPPYADHYNGYGGAYPPPPPSSSYHHGPPYGHDHHSPSYPPHHSQQHGSYPPYDHSYRPYDDRPPTPSNYYDSRPPPAHHGGGYPPPPAHQAQPPQPTRPSVAHTYRDPTTVVRDTSNIIIVPGFEGGFADEHPVSATPPVTTATAANITNTPVTAPSPSPIAPSLAPGAPLAPTTNLSPPRHTTNTMAASGSRRSHSYRRPSKRGEKSERRSHVVQGSSRSHHSRSHHVDSRSRTSSKASPSRSHRRHRDRDQTLGFPRFNGQLPRRGGARPFVQVAVGDIGEIRRVVRSSQPSSILPAESTHTILYGRYKLMGALGKGVSSIVIKAEDLAWGGDGPDAPTSDLTSFEHRYVAIKVFRGTKTYDTACEEEAGLLEMVSSSPPQTSSSSSTGPAAQYVLPLLRHIPHPSHAALVFPVAGPTLFHYLQRSLLHTVGLPVPDVIAILHQLLTSLAHMHARGVVHTDLKPENIVVVLPPFESEEGSGTVEVYEGGPLPMQHLMVSGPKAEEQVAARLRIELTHLENDIKSQGHADGDNEDEVIPPLMEELGQGWSEDSYHESPKASHKLCQELLESHTAGTGIGFHIPRFVPDAGVPRCEVRVIDLGNSRTGGCDASGAGPRRRRRVEHSPLTRKDDADGEDSGAAPPAAVKKMIELTDPHQLVRSAVPWFPAFPSDVIQTSHYRAPEVMLGADWDARVDVWSVGCLVTELLSGVELFHSCDSDVDHLALIEHILTHNKNDSKSEAVRIFPTSFYNRDTCLDFSKFFSSRHNASDDGSRLRLRDPMRDGQRTNCPSLSERFSERASWSFRTPSNITTTNDDEDVAETDEVVAVDESINGSAGGEEDAEQLSTDHQTLKLLFGLTRSLLNVDPTTRLTAAEALNHPVFANL